MNEARPQRVLAGVAWMALGMSAIAIVDSIVKFLAQRLHGVQVTWGYFLMVLVCFFVAAIVRGIPVQTLARSYRFKDQCARGFTMLISVTCLFFSLRYLPLAEATTIGFMAPLFIVALSGPMLGEQVSLGRWLAVMCGLIGAIIVIRPGMGILHWSSLVALFGAFFFGLFNLFTRKIGHADSAWTTLFYSFSIAVGVLSLVMPLVWITPTATEWSIFFGAGVVGLLAHYSIVRSLTLADASVVAPLNYVRIVWAVAIGWYFFGDRPDPLTLLGGSIIVLSGLYVVLSSRKA